MVFLNDWKIIRTRGVQKVRGKKTLLLLASDICIIWASIIGACVLWDGSFEALTRGPIYVLACCSTMIIVALMIYSKLYKRVWRYASVGEMIGLARSVIIGGVVSFGIAYLITGKGKMIIIGIISTQSILLLMGGFRFAWRMYRDRYL